MGNSVQDQLLALEYHHPFAACYSVALDKLVVFSCPTSNLQCCVVVPMPFPSLTLFSFVSRCATNCGVAIPFRGVASKTPDARAVMEKSQLDKISSFWYQTPMTMACDS